MPGARHSPINTTWNQSSQSLAQVDTSVWGVKYNHSAADQSQPGLKPPLPPRVPASQSQPHLPINENRQHLSRENEAFEYLRPVAYSPATSPSIPQGSSPSVGDRSASSSTQSEPQRLPPPPPPKVATPNGSNASVTSDSHRDSPSLLDGPDRNQAQPADHRSKNSIGSTGQQMQETDVARFKEPSTRNDDLQQEHRASDQPNSAYHNAGADSQWHSQSSKDYTNVGPAASGEWPSNPIQTHDEAVPQHTAQAFAHTGRPMMHEVAPASSDEPRSAQIPTGASLGQETSAIHGEGQNAENSHAQVQRDDSFYWHSSPHSSMSHERDQNQDIPGTSSLLDATPEPQDQHLYDPPREEPKNALDHTTNLYQSTLGPYSASALGFGGPSDWEHFGDYDGEEVDDTDLYIRSSSPAKRKAPEESSELPADSSIEEEQPAQQPITTCEPVESFTNTEHEPPGSMLNNEVETTSDHVRDLSSPVQKHNVDDSTEPVVLDTSDSSMITQNQQPSLDKQEQFQEHDAPQDPRHLVTEHVEQDSAPNEKRLSETDTDGANGPTAALMEPRPTSMLGLRNDIVHASAVKDESSQIISKEDGSLVTERTTSSDCRDERRAEQLTSKPGDASFEVPNESRSEGVEPSSDIHDFSREDSIRRASLVSDGSLLSKTKEMGDPYVELDPWARASLNRYIAMLREEARATSDTEKLNLFKAFSRKEWKLRAVLYGADDEQGDTLSMINIDHPVRRPSTMALRRPPSKALPALPPDAERSESEADSNVSLASPRMRKPSLAQLRVARDEGKASRSTRDETHVTLDTPGGRRQELSEDEITEAYSPGGRPLRTQPIVPRKSVPRSVPDSGPTQNDKPRGAASEARMSVDKPAYTPFRYSQGYLDETEQPIDRRASFRPYAALKLEPVEDRANSAPEPISESPTSSSSPPRTHDHQLGESAFLAGQHPPELKTQRSFAPDQTAPLDLRKFERADFDPLTAVLPSSGDVPKSAAELSSLRYGIDSVPDDFSFIHEHVVAWDVRVKITRTENEKERQIRQGESEQRIDALFNDDEIGYGDISELESEFKRAEAARKTEEDRAEYQTFVAEVFDVVWTRLHFEIDQLSPLYDEYTGLAHETVAGKDMFEATPEQFALAPTMSAVLTLHQKLEIRHQKAFEAVLERDRKLKKTEVAQYYTLANIAKVKQLEKQFEQAERKAIVEYCKQRDRRANRLMDVLDQNTLRGVGANQDYMEAVMKAVRRIASGRAFASAPSSEHGLGMNEVIKAKAVTAVLASSSEQIVQTFHVADMLLNAADYELSVATARLANAEPLMFERLQEERASEDAKLMRDLQHRLALIREDLRRTNDEIVKLLCFLGVQGGHAQVGSVPNNPPDVDTEHQQRLQKALEDAKKRNAQKAAGDGVA
ncbi:MAG: hypothetical protein Q9218_001150 [Villophora microphyllina]